MLGLRTFFDIFDICEVDGGIECTLVGCGLPFASRLLFFQQSSLKLPLGLLFSFPFFLSLVETVAGAASCHGSPVLGFTVLSEALRFLAPSPKANGCGAHPSSSDRARVRTCLVDLEAAPPSFRGTAGQVAHIDLFGHAFLFFACTKQARARNVPLTQEGRTDLVRLQ